MSKEDVMEELEELAGTISAATRRRDQLVVQALGLGVKPGEIAAAIGVSRAQVYRIKRLVDTHPV